MTVIDKPVKSSDRAEIARRASSQAPAPDDPFSLPRDFHGFRFIYFTVSPRAHGLSLGINFNPDKRCDFDCVYCEVDRSNANPARKLDCDAMAAELSRALRLVVSGELYQQKPYSDLPPELTRLRHLTLSGDGEPTLAPNFLQGLETVIHQRAIIADTYIPVVLVTNGSGLDRPEVQSGLELFSNRDQIWIKLDAGCEEHLQRVNRSAIPLDHILRNILLTSKKHPVRIQTLFSAVDNRPPSDAEIRAYSRTLCGLRDQGARIEEVQIYSATRPPKSNSCSHLALRHLFEIAKSVRSECGLRVEVY